MAIETGYFNTPDYIEALRVAAAVGLTEADIVVSPENGDCSLDLGTAYTVPSLNERQGMRADGVPSDKR